MKKTITALAKIKLMDNNAAIKWILFGIPFVIIAAFPLHFLYERSNNNLFVGLFAPVNESVWEHLKLVFWPILLWWGLGYSILKNKIDKEKWFVSLAISQISCVLFIVSFFYVYTGAFGIESLFLDILSLVLGVIVSQLLAVHIYKYSHPSRFIFYVSISLIIIMACSFIYFTFNPPHIPMFLDPISGKYGINII